MTVYQRILDNKHKGVKLLALLIDPDKYEENHYQKVFQSQTFDLILIGGSLITSGNIHQTIDSVKSLQPSIPVIIFPGDTYQISKKADAILFLSLISGRNAELLIGKHVLAAPQIKALGIESISTGYILIESGKLTTVSYITQTLPIPNDKPEIAASTALAGEMLGMKMIYLEAGSGAENSIGYEMVKSVKQHLQVPLIVGGGIQSKVDVENYFNAGADIVVVGTHFEKHITF
jgi:phosphoglycerol geranylgeranyltransferase